MPGFSNGTMFADNVDFSGASPVTAKVTADGQLLIGSTASPNIRVATLSAAPGITITNGAGSITIGASSPVNFSWNTITSATNPNTIAVFNGYITAGVAQTNLVLPVAANVGDVFMVTGYSSLFQIQQNANQKIYFGSQTTSTGVGGSLTSTVATDHVFVLCVIANLEFKIIDSIGNFTVV